jgi:hypothetical protein
MFTVITPTIGAERSKSTGEPPCRSIRHKALWISTSMPWGSKFYINDVTWITVDSGQVVHGPSVVRDFILELHSKMFDGQQRSLVVSDGHAYLEGDCVNAPG